MATFFLPDPTDYIRHFDESWEVVEWTAEGGATISAALYTDDTDHPACMSVTSDTDGKGVYIDIADRSESTKHRVEFSYKNGAGQEIDYVIYDQTGSANIETGTLDETSWSNFYTEVTTPAGCATIRIYLRAGTAAGTAFYIDDILCQGNVINMDPALHYLHRIKASSRETSSGRKVTDQDILYVDMNLSWPFLSQADFEKIRNVVKSVDATVFDDGDVPPMIERGTLYTETSYDYTGITNPSASHIAWESESSSEPAADDDFESTEFATADYGYIDGDDASAVTDTAGSTGNYQYHKFRFDISGEYTSKGDVQSLLVTWKGLCNDASSENQDGVKMLLWNDNASNWVEVKAHWSTDKTTLSFSTTRPEIAQMFCDITNGYFYVLIQSHNQKGSGTALSLSSYYIEVTINPELSTTVSLLNKAILDSGDVVYVKNLTTGSTLTLATHYTIGDDRKSIITSSQSAGDVIEVKYNQYFSVKGTNLAGQRVLAAATSRVANPGVKLESQVGIK